MQRIKLGGAQESYASGKKKTPWKEAVQKSDNGGNARNCAAKRGGEYGRFFFG